MLGFKLNPISKKDPWTQSSLPADGIVFCDGAGHEHVQCGTYRFFFQTALTSLLVISDNQDDVIKWKHFPRYWPFVRGIHRSPMNSPHKGLPRGALMFSLIYAWINDWVNNREAGDLRRHRAHYDVIVMYLLIWHLFRKRYLGWITNSIDICSFDSA